MSVLSLMTQTLTVYRKASVTRDEIGGEVIATETPVQVAGYIEPLVGGSNQQEAEMSGNTQLGDWIAFVPADTDVTGWDRIEYGGFAFDITGPPAPMWNPRLSAYSHIELALRVIGDAAAPWVPS